MGTEFKECWKANGMTQKEGKKGISNVNIVELLDRKQIYGKIVIVLSGSIH